MQIEHIRQAVAIDPIDTLDTPVRNRLGQRIQQGLSAGEFHLVFQGIYGARTLELERIEALIRWNHPDYGLLLPDAFVPALHDDLEVAVDVTHFVIDRACAQLAACLRAGQKALPLAVNVPPSVAAQENFAAEVEAIAQMHGVAPALLEIELVETEDTAKILATRTLTRPLREAGIRISMDDFGTGYSSFALLSEMDVDTVKLARELLAFVPTRQRASAVIAGILALLEKLDIRVVVEGVETADQAHWLAQWPNVLVQGYYFSRPTGDLSAVLDGLDATRRSTAAKTLGPR
ncbi:MULTISPECIES: EAL domain-containing protein [Paraburkholderia]|uniref:EAL domain-containing protein n=1 Tax=Paraburkholderia TaxID=1822464 RepID=UPI00225A5A86|nr:MULTISPECIES: EAL domain-containing protein [Paraburkholderia]MCX4161549.1 EAL domain-containing protein [Paraburkholderia megapolitana]MDN7157045.1 EAL domain-containing protein [Paraburkholderia sp. CHISQ3]MDQ6494090.1 EAL domain-containing protein [Paraburkholderia megapolitana]